MRAIGRAGRVGSRRHRGAAVLVALGALVLTVALAPAAAGETPTRHGDPTPAAIEGQVLGTFDPLGGATVEVLSARTGRLLARAVADGSGYYRVGGIRPGDVVVRASLKGWVTGYADGAASRATARVFTLLPGMTLTQSWDPMSLYIDLVPVSVVGGRVVSSGAPLARAVVTVLDATTGRVLGHDRTGADGVFTVGDLPGGAVKVRVARPGWSTVYAPAAPTFATGTTYQVTWWTPLELGDVALAPRGHHGG